MEDTLFGYLLFVIIYTFLCCLFHQPVTASTPTTSPVVKDNISSSSDQTAQKDETSLVVQGSKEHEQRHNKTTTTKVENVTENVSIEALLEGIEVNKITLRQARKIASALHIRQKVNGKDQPKKWLVSQIAKRLEANPAEVAPIIVAKVRAA
ncbi:conserved hypothetical protein [Hyella patelloides LEGE 07179]|uniref:Uncharacterized protein n=1 Tax=Hyella patelloides LEGE 07179 TaxID=945734 RepID=A0A563W4Q2_9CYAN|nr:hypothetical protein [Hyella patelloides]VEP18671.1 conserved hypothetical protein [Hyella patelloides LEGE 07179]